MIDLTKLGGSAGGGAMPSPGTGAGLSPLPSFPPSQAPNPDEEKYAGHNMIWDQVGRAIFGDNDDDKDGQHGGLLGDVPLVGGVMRAPGNLWGGLMDAGGAGLGAIFSGAGEVLGRLPSVEHLTDNYGLGQAGGSGINPFDPKYPATASGAFALMNDLKAENGQTNIARQFMVLGQWQEKNDPEAFKAWKETLSKAQQDTGLGSKAGEYLSNYLRQFGTAYADLTPEGITGWLDVAPELAFGTHGSFGQGLVDGLGLIMTAQRHVEIGAAQMSGNQGGLPGALGGHRIAEGYIDMGSRLNELLHLSDNDPGKLTETEAAAVYGMKELGWTARHAYGYLVSRGQGFSSEGVTQMALSFALDPTFVGGLGAGMAASVGAKAGVGGAGYAASGGGRVAQLYQGLAKSIGTTVAEQRAGALGPAWKAARTVIDPFSVFGKGPEGVAKRDVFAAAGIEGTRRGFGATAVSDAMSRAKQWGMKDSFDRAFGQTAMNFARKWVGTEHIDNLLKFTEPGARRVVLEEAIQAFGKEAPKDAATRLADFVQKNREFWLSSAGIEQLTERMVKVTGRSTDEVAEAVKTMSRDEQAVWHALSYSEAWRDFRTAVSAAPVEEWGALSSKLDDLVILNPHELDNIAAQALLKEVSAMKGKAAIKAWNEAAAKYPLIEGLGKVTTGGAHQLERKLNALDRIIQEGGLHTALDVSETKALPASFTRDFLGKWSSIDGTAIWRLGFKPSAQHATGLIYDSSGKLVRGYDAMIENVTDAIPMATGRMRSLTDPLGRLIPQAVKDTRAARAAGELTDSLEVAIRNASDMVGGQRVMTSMEQSFRKQMREAGFTDRVARDIFKQSRDYAQEHGFTLAGMSPEEFWRVNKNVLGDLVDARVAKRDVFTMLAKSAGGDLRLLGLSVGMTQRIRSGLIARGLDPNNYMGAVTVKLYNLARYTLNPMFFLQAEFDAPWFNMYRGVMFDLRGKMPKPGTAVYEMQGITEAMATTHLSRDLAMDFTERTATIGWQREVADQLKAIGFEQGLGQRIKNRLGRLILNNEMLYLNSRIGDVVIDAIDTTKRVLQERAAAASNPEEAALWSNQKMDVERVFEHLTEELTSTLGRTPTKSELGRRYLSEMIEDSHLEVRTKEGLLEYKRVAQKGEYYKPASIGELKPLNLDYGAESLGLPNIHSAADLRVAIDEGVYTTADVRDMMKQLGYHPDHIKRFMNGLTFDWRRYFDGMRRTLGMSKYEMQGIEDLVTREAKALGMSNVDYITQVLPLTSAKAKKVTAPKPRQAGDYSVLPPDDEPGYVYHVTSQDDLDSIAATGLEPRDPSFRGEQEAWPDGSDEARSYFTSKASTTQSFQAEGTKPAILRVKADSKFRPERGTGDIITTDPVSSGAIEYLDSAGKWQPLVKQAPVEQPMADLAPHVKTVLDVLRLAEKGEAGLDDMTRLVAANLHPSMKQTLLDHFMERITGKDGLIEQAMARGDAKAAQDLNLVLEDLRGGWGDVADREFRDLVIRRASGEAEFAGRAASTSTAAPARFTTDARGNAVLPRSFSPEQGYIYRVTSDGAAAAPWEPGVYASRGKPDTIYVTDPGSSRIVRAKDPGNMTDATGGVNAGSNGRLVDRISPASLEFLAEDGTWHPVVPGAAWKHPGPRPKSLLDKDAMDKMTQEELIAHYDKMRPLQRKWDVEMSRGVSIGAIDPKEADAAGWSFGSGRADDVKDLPETLYHATTDTEGVLRGGLKTRSEAGKTALGGGPDDTISMTHDKAIADRISEVLLEANDILNGRLGFDDLVERAEKGGFLDKWIELQTRGNAETFYRAFRDRMKTEFKSTSPLTVKEMPAGSLPDETSLVEGAGGVKRYTTYYRPMTDEEFLEELFDAYRGPFNLAQEMSGGPMDPMFFSPNLENLKNLDRSKVGVITAKAKPGAKGIQVSSLGEWRTWSGEAFDIEGAIKAPKSIAEPEVERAARYFSQYVQGLDPRWVAGDVLKQITDAIPVEGASPYNFTQGVLMNTLAENFRIAEKDAIRLAHMQTERSVLERSMNHPFFALYPSSYFWGKVVPETFRFIAYEPFGMRTTLGLEAYLKTKQSIELQSMYDDRMSELWDSLGKSAVMGLLSYLSPSMPWEDMKSNLPPWVRALAKGQGFEGMLTKEFDTFSPERWVSHFVEAGEEVVSGIGGAIEGMTQPQEQGLNQIMNSGRVNGKPLTEGTSLGSDPFDGPVQGAALGPTLEGAMADLQRALSGE